MANEKEMDCENGAGTEVVVDSEVSADASGLSENVHLDPYGIPLHPEPTTDPLDPLNFSSFRKQTILFIACYSSFLAVYMTCTTIASFFLLQEQFNVSYSKVNWTLAIPSLGLGAGPLLFSSLADIYGRRPVMIATAMFTMIATGCTTIKTLSYGGYMAFRFLQGVGAGPCTVIAFGLIRDISFEHERGLRVGAWVLAVDIGGLMGALIGGFTATTGPFWAQYHVCIAYGVLVCLEVFLLPETLYPRALILARIEQGQELSLVKRTLDIKVWEIIRVPGIQHAAIYDGFVKFFEAWTYYRLVFVLLPYVFFQYWWGLSLLTMVPAAYYQYTPQIQGLMFLGLIIGCVVAELTISGRLSDYITARLALKNDRVRTPEMRLWLGYIGAVFGCVGMAVWGYSIDREWHWMTGQVAFFLASAGTQISNTAVSTYVFDCYSNHIITVMIFYIVIYNISAFAEPWFINDWVTAVGYSWCFLTQGLITLLLIPSFFALQRLGPTLAKHEKYGKS